MRGNPPGDPIHHLLFLPDEDSVLHHPAPLPKGEGVSSVTSLTKDLFKYD